MKKIINYSFCMTKTEQDKEEKRVKNNKFFADMFCMIKIIICMINLFKVIDKFDYFGKVEIIQSERWKSYNGRKERN